MAATFPKGWVCPEAVREMYVDHEKALMPIIKAKSMRLNRFARVDIDDAIQEGRLALLSALARYDVNRAPHGDANRFIMVVLNNTYKGLLYEALSQSRMPRMAVQGMDGEWKMAPRVPLSLDEALEDTYTTQDEDSPETDCVRTELETQARVFRLRMLNRLQGHDLDVFNCRVNPPAEFLKMVQNQGGDVYDPTNLHIAQYLSISKNEVDGCLYRIKTIFTKMCRDSDFIDLFGDTINGRGNWPMIHVSTKDIHDVEFVKEIIAARSLDPRPVEGYHKYKDHCQIAPGCARMIERYSWGIVLVLRFEGECRTMVIEGKFNPVSGDVFGKSGAREKIRVPWYQRLVKTLKEHRAHAAGTVEDVEDEQADDAAVCG